VTNTTLPLAERLLEIKDAEYRELMIAYRRHLRARGLGDGTVQQRLLHIDELARAVPNVLSVTTEDLESFLSRRRHTHAPESRRSMRSSWMVFYKWAVKAGHIEVDPTVDLAPVRLPRSVARIAKDEQVVQGLATASLPEKAMVLLGRLAALRLSEISGLHMFDREGAVLRIKGKGEHTRMVPINDELLDVLERLEHLQGGQGYYFPGRFGGHLHPQSVCKIIKRVVGTNPHSLRHAAATAAYDSTHDLRAVQEFLGHANLSTTERYIHVKVDAIRAAANSTSLGLARTGTTAIERA
jgi:site-specific recombinase XerD